MTKRIPLSNSTYTLVDDQDFDYLSQWSWYVSSIGYVVWTKKQKKYMHRMIVQCPKGMVVDHIDGNKLNNQRNNLRVCMQGENVKNQALSKKNTSGFKGVCWDKRKNKWMSRINLDGKNCFVGYFTSIIDAAKAYDRKARELFGEFARTNFKEG